MKRLLRFSSSKKKLFLKAFFATLLVAVVFIGISDVIYAQSEGTGFSTASANLGSRYLMNYLAKALLQIVQWIGNLLVIIVSLIAATAQYSNFENEAFVLRGWTAVRDIANMFFIIVLLIIAVATILRIEQYSARRLLFKLLLMALLINFSKSIVGFLIEISQVVMQFFVDAFKGGIAGIILKDLLHIDILLDISTASGMDLDLSGIFGMVFLAGIMLIIAVVVTSIILVIFLYRIIFLWVLIILSPLVFLLHAVPSGTKYASQWWGMFSKYAITGPVLAFFLWLAFSTISVNPEQYVETTSSGTNLVEDIFRYGGAGLQAIESPIDAVFTGDEDETAAIVETYSKFFQSKNLFTFLVGIGFLVGALWATSQLGVAGAGMASKGIARMQHYGTAPLRGMRRMAAAPVRYAGREVGRQFDQRLLRPTLDVLGRLPRFLGGNAAARGASTVGRRVEARNVAAGEFVRGLRDYQTLARIANQSGDSPEKRAARRMAPSAIQDPVEAQQELSKLDRTALRTLSANEIYHIQERGLKFDNWQRNQIRTTGSKEQRLALEGDPTAVPPVSRVAPKGYTNWLRGAMLMRTRYQKKAGAQQGVSSSDGGVTLGGFGNEGSKSIALRVDFEELNRRLAAAGSTFKPAHGVRVGGEHLDAARTATKSMIEDNLKKLSSATTRDEKISALRSFGRTYDDPAKVDDSTLDEHVAKTRGRAERSMARLDDKQSISSDGLVLEERGGTKATLSHELRGHMALDLADEKGDTRRNIFSQMSDAEKTKMKEYLTSQGRLSQDENENIDEYFADILGGQTEGSPETKQKLKELTKDTRTMAAQEDIRRQQAQARASFAPPAPEGEAPEFSAESDDEVRHVAGENPQVKTVIQEVGTRGGAISLMTTEEYVRLRRLIRELNEGLNKNLKKQQLATSALADRIARLDIALPQEGATPLEIKAHLEEAEMSEGDVADFFSKLKNE